MLTEIQQTAVRVAMTMRDCLSAGANHRDLFEHDKELYDLTTTAMYTAVDIANRMAAICREKTTTGTWLLKAGVSPELAYALAYAVTPDRHPTAFRLWRDCGLQGRKDGVREPIALASIERSLKRAKRKYTLPFKEIRLISDHYQLDLSFFGGPETTRDAEFPVSQILQWMTDPHQFDPLLAEVARRIKDSLPDRLSQHWKDVWGASLDHISRRNMQGGYSREAENMIVEKRYTVRDNELYLQYKRIPPEEVHKLTDRWVTRALLQEYLVEVHKAAGLPRPSDCQFTMAEALFQNESATA